MNDADRQATSADNHLTAYLADRDEPCPACTYSLRGLKTDRCPECNRELILQIRLAEPLVRRRRRFGNLSVGARTTAALGAWLLTLASAFVFFVIVGHR